MRASCDRLLELCVVDVMNPGVISLRCDDSMATAAETFVERRITGAPVVDSTGRCVGVISVSDFVERDRALCQTESSPSEVETAPRSFGMGKDTVGEHMTSPAKTVDAHTPVLEAALVMCEHHIHRLPVTNGEGMVTGVVSSLDLVAALVNAVASSTDVGAEMVRQHYSSAT